jgi:hypothetical protein
MIKLEDEWVKMNYATEPQAKHYTIGSEHFHRYRNAMLNKTNADE